jgi:hypothetical protein
VTFDNEGSFAKSVDVAAVHLPTGDGRGRRQRILEQVGAKCSEDKMLIVGDMNVKDDAEVKALCKELDVQEARYAGVSWGVKDNRFYKDSDYRGAGLRKDRVLFGKDVWAETHVVGQGKRFFAGHEFYMSDHFGIVAYADVGSMYASKAKQDTVVARARRGQLVGLRDQAQQKELVEVRSLRQAGREDLEFARRRAAERDRADFQRAQQRAARQRRMRRAEFRSAAFGAGSLFAETVVSHPASGACVPCEPADVPILALNDVPRGSWATTVGLALRGIRNLAGCTCYVNGLTQVLIRTPVVAEWLEYHNAESCPQEGSTCVACAMWLTRCQVFGGFQGDEGKFSVLARRRRHVDEVFHGSEQHCVIEFFDKFCDRARIAEISAGRFGYWGGLQIEDPKATHVDRIFGFVLETRRRCTVCQLVRSWFASERVLRIEPAGVDGGPLTVAEMYYRSCALSEIDVECPVCAKFTKHECQSRMRSAPNVLVVQVKRGDGTRRAVGHVGLGAAGAGWSCIPQRTYDEVWPLHVLVSRSGGAFLVL